MAEYVLYARLLAYALLTILTGFVIPVYHRSFRLTWRALGLFFAAGAATIALQLYVNPEAAAAGRDWCLTPLTFFLVLVMMYNLRLVNLWRRGQPPG